MELFADLKARRVGDVLTIRLTESTNASKSAVTKTAKTTGVNNTGPTLFGKTITAAGVPIPADKYAGLEERDRGIAQRRARGSFERRAGRVV